MFANVRTRFTHLVWNLIQLEHDHATFGPFVWLGTILALLAAIVSPAYALVYLLSGDVAWSVVAGVAMLTLTTGTLYSLIGVDETR